MRDIQKATRKWQKRKDNGKPNTNQAWHSTMSAPRAQFGPSSFAPVAANAVPFAPNHEGHQEIPPKPAWPNPAAQAWFTPWNTSPPQPVGCVQPPKSSWAAYGAPPAAVAPAVPATAPTQANNTSTPVAQGSSWENPWTNGTVKDPLQDSDPWLDYINKQRK